MVVRVQTLPSGGEGCVYRSKAADFPVLGRQIDVAKIQSAPGLKESAGNSLVDLSRDDGRRHRSIIYPSYLGYSQAALVVNCRGSIWFTVFGRSARVSRVRRVSAQPGNRQRSSTALSA